MSKAITVTIPGDAVRPHPFCDQWLEVDLTQAYRWNSTWSWSKITVENRSVRPVPVLALSSFPQTEYEVLLPHGIPKRSRWTKQDKKRLYESQQGICNGCKEREPLDRLHVDHIVAASLGGADHISNWQLLCPRCNRIKGDRPMEYLLGRLTLKPRLDPDQCQLWIF